MVRTGQGRVKRPPCVDRCQKPDLGLPIPGDGEVFKGCDICEGRRIFKGEQGLGSDKDQIPTPTSAEKQAEAQEGKGPRLRAPSWEGSQDPHQKPCLALLSHSLLETREVEGGS